MGLRKQGRCWPDCKIFDPVEKVTSPSFCEIFFLIFVAFYSIFPALIRISP